VSARADATAIEDALRRLQQAARLAERDPTSEGTRTAVERAFFAIAPLLDAHGPLVVDVDPEGALVVDGRVHALDPSVDDGPARRLARAGAARVVLDDALDVEALARLVALLGDVHDAGRLAGESLDGWLRRRAVRGVRFERVFGAASARAESAAAIAVARVAAHLDAHAAQRDAAAAATDVARSENRWPSAPRTEWARVDAALDAHHGAALVEFARSALAASTPSATHARLARRLLEAMQVEPEPLRAPGARTFVDVAAAMLRRGDFEGGRALIDALRTFAEAATRAEELALVDAVRARLTSTPVLDAARRALDRRGESVRVAVEDFVLALGPDAGPHAFVAASAAETPLARTTLATLALRALEATPENLEPLAAQASDALAETLLDIVEGAAWSEHPELAADAIAASIARGLSRGPTPTTRRLALMLAYERRARWRANVVADGLRDPSEGVVAVALAVAALAPTPILRDPVRARLKTLGIERVRPVTTAAAFAAAARHLGETAVPWLLGHVEHAAQDALAEDAAEALALVVRATPEARAQLTGLDRALRPRARRIRALVDGDGRGLLARLDALVTRGARAPRGRAPNTPRPTLEPLATLPGRDRGDAALGDETWTPRPARVSVLVVEPLPPKLPPEALTPLPPLVVAADPHDAIIALMEEAE
jgi:hypothetical protein